MAVKVTTSEILDSKLIFTRSKSSLAGDLCERHTIGDEETGYVKTPVIGT